jgi:hypothetical protein
MIKRLYALIISLLTVLPAVSQTRGNEWIDYSQKYLKIKVAADGIYRIDSTTLANAIAPTGFSLSLIDPRSFQVFANGTEEYIWVQGESDGVFNNGDFIEFIGRKNRGAKDAELYNNTTQLNPYFSLFTDTTTYFLTWNSSTNNRRYTSTNDTTFSAYTLSSYFMNEEISAGGQLYLPGKSDPSGITDPEFLEDEGFYFYDAGYGSPQTFNMNSQFADPTGPPAIARLRVGTHSNDWTIGSDNDVRITYPASVFDTIYDGFAAATYSDTFPNASLGATNTPIIVENVNIFGSVSSGRIATAWVTLRYAHTFNMESRTFFRGYLPDHPTQAKSRIAVVNMGGSGNVRYYDLHNHERIDAVLTGNGYEFLISNGNGTEKEFVVTMDANAVVVTSIAAVNTNGSFTDFSLLQSDSAFVLVSTPVLWSVASDYQTYRTSPAGGNRDVVLANVWELYDQFAWGQAYNPLAIRHFCGYLYDTFPTPPAHLLLLGKSVEGSMSRYGYMGMNLVPTMGYPPSDNLITAGLVTPGQWSCDVPTGRIAAQDSAKAQWYLNKVIEYENNTAAEWMKNVLHFGGGTTPNEQQQFAGYLGGFENTIEDTSFGGVVHTYLKTSSTPIQINLSDTLRDQIENGVSIMTFFGHASGTGFDQSIDDPQNYNNFDRYPLLIANSCYAGDIHTTGISSSESFTLLDGKGTIGYIASVSLGSPPFLNMYSGGLYEGIADTLYGRSIGECMKYATDRAQSQSNIPIMRYTAQEMTLQGDPSVVINSFDKPDYVITTPDIYFDIATYPDSIIVNVVMTNIGKAISDTMIVRMQRDFPNGESDTFYVEVPTPKFKDTIEMVIPLDIQRAVGLNQFTVWLDYYNEIDELSNLNNMNSPAAQLLIQGSAIVPVYPYNFAVIPTDSVTLKASTVNPMEPYRAWRFQLDTTDLFNSPFMISYQMYDSGGVVQWHPNLTFTDSTVYFWRVSPDSLIAGDAFLWQMHSFQYITGQTGWGQDHIFQYTNDGYQFVKLNRPQRNFEFVDDVKVLTVKDGVYGFPAIVWNEVYYKLNGATQHIFSCTPAFGLGGVSIAVIDPVSGVPWRHGDSLLLQYPNGVLNCVPSDPIQYLNAFDFTDVDQTNRDYMYNFIDAIPNGYYVLVYSQYLHQKNNYDVNLQNSLQSIGSQVVVSSTIPDTIPWIIWGVKGSAPGSAQEVVGTVGNQYIYLTDTFQTNWNSGYVASPLIGPAQNWGSLHWKQHEAELPDNDSVYLEVIGVRLDGTSQQLLLLDEDSTDYLNLNAVVPAGMFPYLRLVAHMKDDTSRTPPQLDRWHVLFTPWPDAAVNPQLTYAFYNDSLQEGDTARFTVGIENITPWAFTDSLLINSWIIDENRVRHDLPPLLRAPSFFGNTWYPQTINVSTEGYPGYNELWMEINSLGDVNTQPEYVHFNNVIMTPFYVGTDHINPLMDVTFDGVHILDGDIISGKPTILITLKDENQFLALNDTSDFQVFLKSPSQTVAQLIPWSSEMIFTPAQLPNNSAKIVYTPTLLEDGVYELIVQAKDRSDNASGMIDYNISFEVINKATITNVLNYPNPFSTSTRFVFTLTGSQVPDVFTIQIMTITGKVVREIDKDELGNIHVGRNVTDYAWDGLDEFGDPLANGVYLYRVITRMNGDAIEQRESGADPYIINGWGKMYLMR